MNVAIVSTNKNKYSETFIHNHVRLLPCNIHFLFDGYLPKRYSEDRGVTEVNFLKRGKSFFSLFKKKVSDEQKELIESIKLYLLRNKIDVILCEYGPSGVEMMDIAFELKIPLVVHFHGYDAYRKDILESYGLRYSELFFKMHSAIVVSNHMCKQLLDLGCSQNKLLKLYYGVNTKLFDVKNKIDDSMQFVSCGRFVEKKAPNLVIKAFQIVVSKFPYAKLVMIGDGELLEECKSLVDDLGISESVNFTGSLSQEYIAKEFSKSYAYVQHSVTTKENDSEGTPLSILEAMSAGLPIVATKHAGIVDIIKDGYSGFLVDERDYKSMASKMEILISNKQLALNLGENGSNYVRFNNSLELYSERLWQILKEAKK